MFLSSLTDKYKQFMKFAIDGKVSGMVKKKSDDDLIDLYNEYASLYFKNTGLKDGVNLRNVILGAMVVYTVIAELKTRHENWKYLTTDKQISFLNRGSNTNG